MSTAVLEPETINSPLEEVVSTLSSATSPVRSRRPTGVALTFVIGCVTLIMTGFAIIIPVFPQRLQALGPGSEMLALMEGAFGMGMFLYLSPVCDLEKYCTAICRV